MYKYIAYGQKIESEVIFNQFIPANFDGPTDIIIHHFVEENIKNSLTELYQVAIRGRDIYFRNQVGYFEARSGKEIFFEEYSGLDEADAKEFVMGNTMALLFFEKDRIVIHGSAVRFKDKTIILSGDSGAGKSTMASKLIREGGKLISDDQCIVYIKDGNPILVPGYPAQKLCVDASERNNFDVSKLIKVDPHKNKYVIPRKEAFYDKESKVDAIFLLSKHENGEPIVFNEVNGAAKVNELTKNLFLRPFFTSSIGLPPDSMKQCIEIAMKLNIYQISRNNKENTEDEIFRKISERI